MCACATITLHCQGVVVGCLSVFRALIVVAVGSGRNGFKSNTVVVVAAVSKVRLGGSNTAVKGVRDLSLLIASCVCDVMLLFCTGRLRDKRDPPIESKATWWFVLYNMSPLSPSRIR